MKKYILPAIYLAVILFGCSPTKKPDPALADTATAGNTQQVNLPAPYATKPTKTYCDVIGWPKGKTPVAPAGFQVSLYASGLTNPRNIYVAPNGDVFISEANTEVKGVKKVGAAVIGVSKSEYLGKSMNDVLMVRGNGKPVVFLKGLNQPYGMLFLDRFFYVACTDGLWRFPYKPGQPSVTGKGEKILTLPAGGYNNHWTRNIIASPDSSKIYVSVGSGSNDGEHGMQNEVRRADVLEINPDGSGEKIYANGLRNPAGICINPVTKQLWASVNERDNLGDQLVPDYLTSVKRGGFYGWPYAYFGQHEDPNNKGKGTDKIARTIVPDVSLGAHTASLGFTFYNGSAFPKLYHNGAFIGQHGSWNSSKLVGYKVVFVPFNNGKPGVPQDFLTGFIADILKNQVYGRPVGVATTKDGSLLVADDTSNKIWKVSYGGK